MTDAIAPYVGWLGKAAAQAEQSAAQARAAASAFEAALATVVDPGLVATNRGQLLSLVRSNLFGQNAPAIAAAEAAYEQMWAQDVAVMSGYHAGASATVAQLGPVGAGPRAARRACQATAPPPSTWRRQQPSSPTSSGTGPSLPVPATLNPAFVGAPSLLNRVEVSGLWVVKEFVEPFIDNQLANPSSPLNLVVRRNPFPPVKLFISNTPPKFLPLLFGETVQHTTYDGMSVVQITPAHPDGKYVVAIHGGAFIFPPSIFHWFDYALMAYQTGATIEVPIYPLLQQGGTAGVVVPEMAGLISIGNRRTRRHQRQRARRLRGRQPRIGGRRIPGGQQRSRTGVNGFAVALAERGDDQPQHRICPRSSAPGCAWATIGKEWAGGLPENDHG